MYVENPALYIHIPYCFSKCTYCDFFSIATHDGIPDIYIEALEKEFLFRVKQNNVKTFLSVYIGGGTPSLLTISQFTKIISFIKPYILKNTEITVECNCDDISTELLVNLANLGVNRISVGIQSLHEKTLSCVNRRADEKTTRKALEIISEFQKNNNSIIFSVDLISALPNSTTQNLCDDLQVIIAKNIQHVSLYALTIEDKTLLSEQISCGKIPYDDYLADEQWISGRNYLISNGYEEYEISNFAKNKNYSIHNKSYWKQIDYLGIGSGAVGTIYSNDGLFAFRYTNTKNIDLYMNQNFLANEILYEKIENLDKNTVFFEYLMTGFRTSEGINIEDCKKRFNKDLLTVIEPEFSNMVNEKKAIIINKNYSLLPDGMLFLNSFLVEILKKLC